VQPERVAEPGDPQDLQDPVAAGHQRERSPAGTKLLAATHQGAQAGRVEETGAAQVRDDVNGAVTGQAGHPVTDLRRGVGVDVAIHPQHHAVIARGDGLQVKGLHATSVGGPVVLAVPDYCPCQRQNRPRTARSYAVPDYRSITAAAITAAQPQASEMPAPPCP